MRIIFTYSKTTFDSFILNYVHLNVDLNNNIFIINYYLNINIFIILSDIKY